MNYFLGEELKKYQMEKKQQPQLHTAFSCPYQFCYLLSLFPQLFLSFYPMGITVSIGGFFYCNGISAVTGRRGSSYAARLGELLVFLRITPVIGDLTVVMKLARDGVFMYEMFFESTLMMPNSSKSRDISIDELVVKIESISL